MFAFHSVSIRFRLSSNWFFFCIPIIAWKLNKDSFVDIASEPSISYLHQVFAVWLITSCKHLFRIFIKRLVIRLNNFFHIYMEYREYPKYPLKMNKVMFICDDYTTNFLMFYSNLTFLFFSNATKTISSFKIL